MASGACGIDCSVCGLHIHGDCTSCGGGTSESGREKMRLQKELLGKPCPILACAISRSIDHCSRDCADFPCDTFHGGPYPFSKSFLDMQLRRRR
jgi:hypothetical protein